MPCGHKVAFFSGVKLEQNRNGEPSGHLAMHMVIYKAAEMTLQLVFSLL